MPQPKERPKKDAAPRDTAEQAYEIKRLRMKNELLRDFPTQPNRRPIYGPLRLLPSAALRGRAALSAGPATMVQSTTAALGAATASAAPFRGFLRSRPGSALV